MQKKNNPIVNIFKIILQTVNMLLQMIRFSLVFLVTKL